MAQLLPDGLQHRLLNFITAGRESAAALYDYERRHQVMILQNGRVNIIWIIAAIALLLPAAMTSIVLMGMSLVGAFDVGILYRVFELVGIGAVANLGVLLVGMLIASDLVVSLVTLALSANAISREKTADTWDLLLLTGITARGLVLSKWWASLRVIRRDQQIVGLLRLGVLSAAFLYYRPLMEQPAMVMLLVYLLAVGLMVIYSLTDAMLTVALAIWGSLTGLLFEGVNGLGFVFRLAVSLLGVLVIIGLFPVLLRVPQWTFLIVPMVLAVVWPGLLASSLVLARRTAVVGAALPDSKQGQHDAKR